MKKYKILDREFMDMEELIDWLYSLKNAQIKRQKAL